MTSGYGLDDREIGVRSPQRRKDFSSSLWGPPSLLSSRYQGFFPRDKARPGRDADHSPHLLPRCGCGLILRYYPSIRLEGLRETTKTSIRIAAADIWTRNLTNAKRGVYEERRIVTSKERIWMISVHFPESGDLVQTREQWRHKSEGTG
jgi:hypothetical protein